MGRKFQTVVETSERVNYTLSLEDAIKMVTSNVAKGIDQYPRKGAIQVGSDADIVFLGENMAIDTVIARGQVMVEKGENIVMGYYGK